MYLETLEIQGNNFFSFLFSRFWRYMSEFLFPSIDLGLGCFTYTFFFKFLPIKKYFKNDIKMVIA